MMQEGAVDVVNDGWCGLWRPQCIRFGWKMDDGRGIVILTVIDQGQQLTLFELIKIAAGGDVE